MLRLDPAAMPLLPRPGWSIRPMFSGVVLAACVGALLTAFSPDCLILFPSREPLSTYGAVRHTPPRKTALRDKTLTETQKFLVQKAICWQKHKRAAKRTTGVSGFARDDNVTREHWRSSGEEIGSHPSKSMKYQGTNNVAGLQSRKHSGRYKAARIYLGILTLVGGLVAGADAQTNFVYSFTGSTTGTPTSGTSNNVSAGAFSIGNSNGTVTAPIGSTSASSGYTTASGVAASAGNNIGTAAFTGALSTTSSSYFAFTLTPSSGLAVQLSGLNFGERSTSTGAVTFALYSSDDGYTNPVTTGNAVTAANTGTWAAKDFGTVSFTSANAGSAVTFRIYAYGGTGTAAAGTVNTRLDDITVVADGVSAAVPEPTTVLGGLLLVGAAGWSQRRRLLGMVQGWTGSLTTGAV